MATLKPYFGPDTSGAKNRIMAQLVFWVPVGSGKYEKFEDFETTFTGKIETVFYTGDVNVSLTLTDRDPAAPSGPCTIVVNGASFSATYKVADSKLHVSFEAANKPYDISFTVGGGGTYIGGLPLNGWVGP